MATRQYIGARYVPKFADPIEWDSTRGYEALEIVTHLGTSYTSKKPVPAGTAISNSEYWVSTGNYNAQVELYRQQVEEYISKTNVLEGITDNFTGNIHNILDYGAKGDGVTDDTQAIKTAIADCNAGDTIFFPNGTYIVSDTIDINKQVHLTGISYNYGNGSVLKTSMNKPLFNVTSWCTIENFRLHGSLDSDKQNQIGIFVNETNCVKIKGCNFFDFYDAIHFVDTCFYCEVIECDFYSCISAMIYCYNTVYGANDSGCNILFDNCNMISNSGTYGIRIANLGSCIFTNCEMSPTNFTDSGLFIERCASMAGVSFVGNCSFEEHHAIKLGTTDYSVKYVYFSNVYAGGGIAVNVVNATECYFNNCYFTNGPTSTGGIRIATANKLFFNNCLFQFVNAGFYAPNDATFKLYLSNCSSDTPYFIYLGNVSTTGNIIWLDNVRCSSDGTSIQINDSGTTVLGESNNVKALKSSDRLYYGTLDANGVWSTGVSDWYTGPMGILEAYTVTFSGTHNIPELTPITASWYVLYDTVNQIRINEPTHPNENFIIIVHRYSRSFSELFD